MSERQHDQAAAQTCKHGYAVEGDELARSCLAGETEALCAQRPMPDESRASSTEWREQLRAILTTLRQLRVIVPVKDDE